MERSTHKNVIYGLLIVTMLMSILTIALANNWIKYDAYADSKDALNLWYGYIGYNAAVGAGIMLLSLDKMHPVTELSN